MTGIWEGMSPILCVAPHPDDAELCAGGLLLLARQAGHEIVVVDCTRGEMGTRGSVAERKKESAQADRLLGTKARLNLALPDGHLHDDERLKVALVRALRKFRPQVVLFPHWEDKHPDHAAVGRAAEAVAWLCGAPKFDPKSARGIASKDRPPYRPDLILYYNNRYGIEPDLVVDITPVFARKAQLVECYATQFGPRVKNSKHTPQTLLSTQGFLDWFRSQHAHYGFKIGAPYGEAYCVKGPLSVREVSALLSPV